MTYLCSRREGVDLEGSIVPHKIGCGVSIGGCQSHSCDCSLLSSNLPQAALHPAYTPIHCNSTNS